MHNRRRFIAGAATAAAGIVVTACGGGHDMSGMGGPTSSVAPTADHNSADIAFAKGMVPHHAQAIEMADLAPSRAATPSVKELAAQIKAAQDPEIVQMKAWLTSWGESSPASSEGMGHGMMSAADLKALESAVGPAFDKLFLAQMIEHHEGAIVMAKAEQQDGKYQPAKDLAAAIVTAQEKEIAEMRALQRAG